MEVARRLTGLAQNLIEKVSSGGKIQISIWQLRWILSQHDSPEDVVAAASQLVAPRPPESFRAVPMAMAALLKRTGLLKYTCAFRGAWANVRDVMALCKEEKDLRNKIADNAHRALLWKAAVLRHRVASHRVGRAMPTASAPLAGSPRMPLPAYASAALPAASPAA